MVNTLADSYLHAMSHSAGDKVEAVLASKVLRALK